MNCGKAGRGMRWILLAAGLYNLIWAGVVVLLPLVPFRWAGMQPPSYLELWQCLGIIVGVYGVGYILAARDPFRYWPIVLVGLLWKVAVPAGFLSVALDGRLPWVAGWTIIANGLIWWVPFGWILYGVYQSRLCTRRMASPEIRHMALRKRTQYGKSLLEHSKESPLLLVFLRHFGCTFCREALADLAAQRRAIESKGVRIALIHMSNEERGEEFLSKYGLGDVLLASDPHCAVYRAFGLDRGGLRKLFGPKVWWRGLQAGLLAGHGVGRLEGDGFQMPGVFLLFHGEVINSYRHQSAADRPDYRRLASGSSQLM